ncbi:hypothetical protein ACEPAI_1940 [Sanghuangporus weigelae]
MASKPTGTTTTTTTASTSPVRNALSVLGARLTRGLSRDGEQDPSRVVSTERPRASDVDSSVSVSAVKVGLPGVGANGEWDRQERIIARVDKGDEFFLSAATSRLTLTPNMTEIQSLNNSRSPVRGRETFSTGRGGAGNIHRSHSRDADTPTSPPPAGREASPIREPITHVGRGGLGNFRDPSRPREHGVDPKDVIYEHEVIEHSEESPHRFSTGRGGAGNIKTTPEHSQSRERSLSPGVDRSLSRGRALHSTGRGGAGNITAEPLQEETVDELERRARSPDAHHPGELHSSGRGGLANVTTLSSPPVEHIHEGHEEGEGTGIISYGRGGAGNIRDRSASRGGGPRSASRGRGAGGEFPGGEHHHPGPFGKLVDRVKKHHEHEVEVKE